MTTAKMPDFTEMFQSMKMDNDMFKSAAEFNARMSNIMMETARKNNELAYSWAQENLDKLQTLADAKLAPAKLAEKSAEVLNDRMRAAPEQLAKFAEIAKATQTEAVELMMQTGKQVQGEVMETAKKATSKATAKRS